MMAEILRQASTGDGYDVRFIASDGQAYVLHFAATPDAGTVAAALAQYEAMLAEQALPGYVIEAEDGTKI